MFTRLFVGFLRLVFLNPIVQFTFGKEGKSFARIGLYICAFSLATAGAIVYFVLDVENLAEPILTTVKNAKLLFDSSEPVLRNLVALLVFVFCATLTEWSLRSGIPGHFVRYHAPRWIFGGFYIVVAIVLLANTGLQIAEIKSAFGTNAVNVIQNFQWLMKVNLTFTSLMLVSCIFLFFTLTSCVTITVLKVVQILEWRSNR